MKALTLWQPWATAIAIGEKRIETRPMWALRLRALVGHDLAIHAAVRNPPLGFAAGDHRTAITNGPGSALALDHLSGVGPLLGGRSLLARHPLPLGAVVAVVHVEAVLPILAETAAARFGSLREPFVDVDEFGDVRLWTPTPRGPHGGTWWSGTSYPTAGEHEAAWGDYTPGRVAVVFGDVRPLNDPVPCRGYQQAWTLPADVEAAVDVQVSGGRVTW